MEQGCWKGKDNAPRPACSSGMNRPKAAAPRVGARQLSAWTGCASGRRLQTAALLHDCYVFSAIALCLQDALMGNQRQPLYCFGASRPSRSGRRTADRRPGESSKDGQPPRVRLKAVAGGLRRRWRGLRFQPAWWALSARGEGNQGAMGQGRARRPGEQLARAWGPPRQALKAGRRSGRGLRREDRQSAFYPSVLGPGPPSRGRRVPRAGRSRIRKDDLLVCASMGGRRKGSPPPWTQELRVQAQWLAAAWARERGVSGRVVAA